MIAVCFILAEGDVFVQEELDQHDDDDRREFGDQFVPMQVVDKEMQEDGTEEQSEDAHGEENGHPPESMVRDLEIVFPVQQETAQDAGGAADDVGQDVMDRSPACQPRQRKVPT